MFKMSFLIHKNESLDIKNERKRIFVTQLRYVVCFVILNYIPRSHLEKMY